MRIIRMRALLAMLGTAVLLGGCSSMPSWMPSWLGGSSSKSAEPAPLVEFAPSLTPRVAWRTSVGSVRRAVLQPAVLENAIYAAAGGGTAGIGPTGEIIWRVDTNTPIAGAVGSDSFVVAGEPRGDVIAPAPMARNSGVHRSEPRSGAAAG
jgi:outer membrane protein assembly factor BamB